MDLDYRIPKEQADLVRIWATLIEEVRDLAERRCWFYRKCERLALDFNDQGKLFYVLPDIEIIVGDICHITIKTTAIPLSFEIILLEYRESQTVDHNNLIASIEYVIRDKASQRE